MKYIEKYLTIRTPKYYSLQISKLNDAQKEDLERLLEKLEKSGSRDPLSWALSEVQENIPQFARFSMLKGLVEIVDDVEGNIGLSDDVDEDYREDIFEIQKRLIKAISEEELNAFLKSYTKGVMYQVANLIDEGNAGADNQPGWVLSEINNDGDLTGRFINGLHESLSEFENELDPEPDDGNDL